MLWYKSSEKRRRDKENRDEKMESSRQALNELQSENIFKKTKKHIKTTKGLKSCVESIIRKHGVSQWIIFSITEDDIEEYKKNNKGRPTDDSRYRKIIKKVPKLIFHNNHVALAKSEAIDGIFPLVTNSSLNAKEVLSNYKGQMFLEKRHSLLKTGLQVAPIFLKRNDRIEGILFVYFIAKMVASLIERDIRNRMKVLELNNIPLLPEDRPTATPTWAQIKRVFEYCMRETVHYEQTPVKCFSENMTEIQKNVLGLLKISEEKFK